MQGVKLRHRFPVSIVWGAMPTRWPLRGVRVRQRINKDPSGPDCEAFQRACCCSPVLHLVVEVIPFVGRCPYPLLRFLSYRGPCGLSSSIDMDGVPTLHLTYPSIGDPLPYSSPRGVDSMCGRCRVHRHGRTGQGAMHSRLSSSCYVNRAAPS